MAKENLKRRILLLLTVLIASLVSSVLSPVANSRAQSDTLEPFELRVMTFNIWVGGELVDFGKVIEAIQASKADVVGLQETGGNIHRIATALGWQYVSERMAVISRFPLIDLGSDPANGSGHAIFVQVRPGQVVAIANTHLPSDPYGPYLVRDGELLDKVLDNERETRMPAIEPILAGLDNLIKAKIPVILTADFNTPSHLDWTEAGVTVRRQEAYPVAWPVTVAIEKAGFRDTYRTVYPDPVAKQGNTWSYGYPSPRLRPDETIDRIDMIFAAGNIDVLNSQIVGETGGPDVDIPITPFPSDHRGVVSTLKVIPVVPPLFVSFDRRRIIYGEPIVVRYHAPHGEQKDRIVIVKSGDDAITKPLMSLPPYEADFFGSVTFGSAVVSGQFDAVLVGEGDKELARNTAWVVTTVDALPRIYVANSVLYQNQDLAVSWSNSPGNRADWIGIYKQDESDLYNYIGYQYTAGAVDGKVTFEASVFDGEPLPAGKYRAVLMLDDGYAVLATTYFVVQ